MDLIDFENEIVSIIPTFTILIYTCYLKGMEKERIYGSLLRWDFDKHFSHQVRDVHVLPIYFCYYQRGYGTWTTEWVRMFTNVGRTIFRPVRKWLFNTRGGGGWQNLRFFIRLGPYFVPYRYLIDPSLSAEKNWLVSNALLSSGHKSSAKG